MVSPEQDAEEANEEGRRDHGSVGEDAAVAEVCQEHGGEAHAGEDGDVDLGVSEEPEEVKPEKGAAVAAVVKDAVDEVASGEEEAGAGVAVAKEKQYSRQQDGEGDDAEEGRGKPSPDGEGKALPGHAGAAVADDGGEGVDRAGGGGDGEEGDACEPQVHSQGLAGACAGDRAEGWVGCPAGDGGASGNEGGAEKSQESRGCQPEAGGVERWEGHAAGADLGGKDDVAEAGLRGRGEDEEEHDGAVDSDEGEVVLGEDGAVQGK